MSKHHAILDLDDTMASMREPLHHILNEESGKDLHWSQWDSVMADVLYGVSGERFFELALQHRLIEKMEPHKETRQFMEHLSDIGVETTILTARGWHPRGLTVTEGWLRYWDIPYSRVKICELADTKADYIQDMDKVLFTVDDSSRHCNGYARSANRPHHVFAYDMPWTKHGLDTDQGIHTIKNLWDIVEIIEGR